MTNLVGKMLLWQISHFKREVGQTNWAFLASKHYQMKSRQILPMVWMSFYLILLILELPLLPPKQPLLNGGGEGEAGAGTLQEVLQHPVHRRPIHRRACHRQLHIHVIPAQQAESLWQLQVFSGLRLGLRWGGALQAPDGAVATFPHRHPAHRCCCWLHLRSGIEALKLHNFTVFSDTRDTQAQHAPNPPWKNCSPRGERAREVWTGSNHFVVPPPAIRASMWTKDIDPWLGTARPPNPTQRWQNQFHSPNSHSVEAGRVGRVCKPACN